MKIFLALIFLSFAFAVIGFNEVPPGDQLWVPLTQIVGGLTVIYFIWLVWKFIRGLLRRVGITNTPKIENSQDAKSYSKLVGTETRENSTAEDDMATKRKSYSDEFKKKVAEAASKSGVTLKSVGEQFGVNPTLVRNWKIQFASSSESNGDDAAVGDANNPSELKINAGWEERDGRTVCRWIVVWSEASEGEIAGAFGGYSGGGSFQMEQFFAKHAGSELTNLMIDTEDKITGEDIDFFDDIPSNVLSICDDAQDVIMEWHDQDEWEDAEQLVLLDDKIAELDKSEEMLLLNGGDSGFNKAILELAGVTAAPVSIGADNNASVDGGDGSEQKGNENIFVWHIKRAKFLFEDASEYEAWKKEKKVYFEMDPSGSDDGGEELFDDPSDGYAEFEIDDTKGNVSISLDDDGPVITAWVKWSPKLRDGVSEDEVLEWGADMGGWYAGTISLSDVDASISEDDGGDLRSLADDSTDGDS